MIKKIEKNGLNEKNKDKKNSGLAAILDSLFIFLLLKSSLCKSV